MASVVLTNKATDAREAMSALITSRALPIREDEPTYPRALAKLAWAIADAMLAEHIARTDGPADVRRTRR